MYIKHLSIVNYKNILQAELDFSSGINCFVGNNGTGKTNLLDSIYYLSFCKSYFNPVDSQVINHGEDFFVVQGSYERNSIDENIYAGLKRDHKKQFKRNKKEYVKLSEHIGLLPLVMVSPADERLITDGSEQRRRYIDSVISQFDKSYLDNLLRYNRALIQRNTLLKKSRSLEGNIASQFDVWDAQLALSGAVIFEKRQRFINDIIPVFNDYYAAISGESEKVDMIYHSHHKKGDLMELLQQNRERDLILGYTTKGIHRDDLELLLNKYPVRHDGSQGQKKSFLIALKFAQYGFLYTQNDIAPILLLDDIFDKLDHERGERLIKLVGNNYFKQIFITDTQKERLVHIVSETGKEYRLFETCNGNVQTVYE
ncbi:MAG: DNA replication/repair protein RecF [Cytophagaceae bacterium]|jgi:DNA replication and repair protein RecF|nr:DNA replication/repair protein RecF [Cytophagaceae bacterium]